jgi:hypothetical protein
MAMYAARCEAADKDSVREPGCCGINIEAACGKGRSQRSTRYMLDREARRRRSSSFDVRQKLWLKGRGSS